MPDLRRFDYTGDPDSCHICKAYAGPESNCAMCGKPTCDDCINVQHGEICLEHGWPGYDLNPKGQSVPICTYRHASREVRTM